jgi:transcriptional regulator with XRE-family HTH domain
MIKIMISRDIRTVLAENLRDLMDGHRLYNTPASVSRRAELAVNTVKNILSAKHYATLKQVEALAEAFGQSPWQLLHPDPERAKKEQEAVAKFMADLISRSK